MASDRNIHLQAGSPSNHEVRQRDRQPDAERLDQEEQGGHPHRPHPSDAVGQPAGHDRSDGGSDQRRGDREAQLDGSGLEVRLHGRHGAVDDGRVEAEEEPPDRRRARDKADAARRAGPRPR
jgi:hypothetical protein